MDGTTATRPVDELAKAFVEAPRTRRGVLKLGLGAVTVATAGALPQWAFARSTKFKKCNNGHCAHDYCGESTFCGNNHECNCVLSINPIDTGHSEQHLHCQCVADWDTTTCPNPHTLDRDGLLCGPHSGRTEHCADNATCVNSSCCGFSWCVNLCVDE